MPSLTFRLDARLARDLRRLARRSGRSEAEIARDALKRYVMVVRFRELRAKILPFAEAQGLLTDEDVFRSLNE
ncbi:MAG: CopG family transcriptional regulator [Betaproteobacteria bacterium RIFCSPLOWO2_12_FULL_68_20]|nr:MAG: CopG family transcriptional regulator [Betaproteobacteria bacterium RIFCSPLOWO2_12_FULL_68_20]